MCCFFFMCSFSSLSDCNCYCNNCQFVCVNVIEFRWYRSTSILGLLTPLTIAKLGGYSPCLLPLQIDNDILLRRSSSLRQGLPSVGVSHGRRKSSLEEIGISHFTTLMQATNHSNPIKISLNGSIGMEVGVIVICIINHKANIFFSPSEPDLLAGDAARGAHTHVRCAMYVRRWRWRWH